MAFHATWMSEDVIVARGGKFGAENAANWSAETFVHLLPRKSLWLKKRPTSGMRKWPATMSEPRRLSVASFCSWKMGA